MIYWIRIKVVLTIHRIQEENGSTVLMLTLFFVSKLIVDCNTCMYVTNIPQITTSLLTLRDKA